MYHPRSGAALSSVTAFCADNGEAKTNAARIANNGKDSLFFFFYIVVSFVVNGINWHIKVTIKDDKLKQYGKFFKVL